MDEEHISDIVDDLDAELDEAQVNVLKKSVLESVRNFYIKEKIKYQVHFFLDC